MALLGTTPLAPRPQLIQQAVYVPEQDAYYVSAHQHDFVHIELADGKVYQLDGGLAYTRRGGDLRELRASGRVIDLTLTTDSPIEEVRRRLLWGSRGPKGDQPLTYRPIAMLTLDHLRAIKRTQPQIVGTIVGRVVDWWIAQKGAA